MPPPLTKDKSMEENLDDVLDQLIQRKLFDSAHQILEMVRPTYSRYEEYKSRLEKARNEK